MKQYLLLFLCVVGSALLNAQPLSLEKIMQGNAFVGNLPGAPFWAGQNDKFYFSWDKEGNGYQKLYTYELAGGEVDTLLSTLYSTLPERGLQWNESRTSALFTKAGDLYELTESGKVRTLIQSTDYISKANYANNDQAIVYVSGNNVFVRNAMTGDIRQLTNFVSGKKESKSKVSAQQAWLNEQQMELFEIVRDWDHREENRTDFRLKTSADKSSKIYLNGQRISGQTVSDDLRFISYRLHQKGQSESTKMPNWVTASGYVTYGNHRPKVGSDQGSYSFCIYDTHRDTVITLDHSKLPGVYAKPLFLKDYADTWMPEYDEARPVIFQRLTHSPSGKYSVVAARSLDNKDRWLMQVNMETGDLSLVDHQHDEAWVGGPNVNSWNSYDGNTGWISDDIFWFSSEVSGYSHLYTYNFKNKKTKALTSGNFEILEAKLTHDHSMFYLLSNKNTPVEQHVYRMSAKGGKMEQVTKEPGGYQFALSPDEKTLALTYSYSNKPTEIYVMPADGHEPMKQITHSTTSQFDSYEWKVPETVQIPASDGQKIFSHIFRPEKSNGKAVVFVHGAGYLQNVHSWWSSYFREYMFHNFLVDQGYTVMQIDYRGSAGYGRDWRTGIYRHMGGKDLSDHVDAVKYLVDNYEVDQDKVGIYGGSYGGFITLMAMFNANDTFSAGAAIRSVTDWAHYNHGYTCNILNTPVEDPEAFQKSSPIYFAEEFQGDLLILHGMEDDNVQFQDVVRLSQRLIELGKENWEMAIYPIEPHGFKEAASWTDEYKRIFKLFENKL